MNIFIAGTWRSGGIHLQRVLAESLGYRLATTTGFHGEGMEQQVINHFNALVLFPYGRQVFHSHCWGTPRNVMLLKDFNVKTIVLTRNPEDIMVSLRERALNDGPVMPGLFYPSDFASRTKGAQYDWLVSHAAPWMGQFMTSWRSADMSVWHLTYEDLFKDQVRSIKEALQFVGIEQPPDAVIAKAASARHNLSVGLVGRGKTELTQSQRDRIKEIMG